MASLMNRASRSVGFSKQQQSAPSTGRAQRLITRVKVETTPEAKTQAAQTNLEYLRSLPGITQPFPDVFDPFGLSTSTQTADLKRWRESEIVHGRVAMLAALGFLVGEQLEDFPAFVNFDGHITGPAIGHFQQVRQGFWEPLIIAIGVAESYRVAIGWATPEGEGFNRLKDDYEPGNLGFDPLNLKPSDPEEYKIMQTKELNNGRLAMIGIAGVVAQELVDHKEVYEHLFRNVESATGIELPAAPKVDLPNTPNLGIPKYDAPVPGPVGGKLGLPTPNLGGALQNNLDKLKVPSSLGGLRTGDVSINLPDVKGAVSGAVNDIKAEGFSLPNPVQALKDNNPVEKLDLPTPNIGESLKNNIEKLKQPSDLAGLRPTDVSVKLPDVKPEDSTPTTGWKFPNPFGDLLRNTMPDVSNPDPNNAGNNDEFITKSPGDLIPQEYFQGPLRKDQNLEQTVS